MHSSSWLLKTITCLITGITVAALLLLLGNSGSIKWFPPLVVFVLVGISLLLAVATPFVWQIKERQDRVNTPKVFSVLHTILRYCMAFNLSSFGWKKLLGLQFVVPDAIASQPMNQQTGEWLTWYYFGYSDAFGFTIAAIQIVGACLLLFKRTVLLATVVLFAFMLQLTMINIFYGMNAGALLQSVVLTLGLLFLLVQDYKRLIPVFLQVPPSLHFIKTTQPATRNLVKIGAILLSLLFTWYLKVSLP